MSVRAKEQVSELVSDGAAKYHRQPQSELVAGEPRPIVVVHAGQTGKDNETERLLLPVVNDVGASAGFRHRRRNHPEADVRLSPSLVAYPPGVRTSLGTVEPVHANAGTGEDPVGFSLCCG